MFATFAFCLPACEKKGEKQPVPEAVDDPVEALQNEQAPLPDKPLTPGQEAYDFSALAHTGLRFKLSQFLERPVLLYFCPQDRTPACQQLALSLKDQWLRLNPSLSMAFGISLDGTFVHRDFASEHELPHLLVSDTEASVHKVFGIPPGSVVSYLVGTDRKVLRVFSPPSAAHADEVLVAVEQLGLKKPPPPR